MNDAVCLVGVRMLAGCFGDTNEQMPEFAQKLHVATAWPLAQFWEGDTSAVADQHTFPLYTLLLGACKRVVRPPAKALLSYKRALDEKWVPAGGYTGLMPQWRLPQWHQWSQDQAAWHQAGDMYWGNVKMKPVAHAHWIAGVCQVVFWCGTAQQGYGAKKDKIRE